MFNQSLLVLDLIGTWLGLGIMGFGTKGLGTGLDNSDNDNERVGWSCKIV